MAFVLIYSTARYFLVPRASVGKHVTVRDVLLPRCGSNLHFPLNHESLKDDHIVMCGGNLYNDYSAEITLTWAHVFFNQEDLGMESEPLQFGRFRHGSVRLGLCLVPWCG